MDPVMMDLDVETRASQPLTYYTPEILEAMKKVFPGDELYPERNSYQCASHIASTVNRWTRERVIEGCVKVLSNLDYDTFAFQGASGIGISMILAHLLEKEVILVRKEGEPRQASARYKVEGYREAKRYVVVDDLISTGITAARVICGVRSLVPNAELAGILLYYEGATLLTPADHNCQWRRVLELANSTVGEKK
jgi:orotate phosphoribosyltransferase